MTALTEGPLLWFLNRGSGLVLLVLLTLTVVLGVLAMGGRPGQGVPRFVTQRLHRNLGLVSVVAVVVHIATAVLDTFVDIRWWHAVVPWGSAYEPLWVGLGTEADFAGRRRALRVGEPGLLVVRQLGEQLTFGLGELDDSVVEPLDGDVPVVVVHRPEHAGQHGERVGDRTAEAAGVHIARRAAQVDLPVDHAAHAGADGGLVRRPHAGVGDDDDVTAQQLAVLAEQVGEVGRPGLFLALDDELEVDRWTRPAGRCQVRLDAECVEEDLTLVVSRSSGAQLLARDRGLERRRLPELERRDRLDVVVAVHDDRGRVRVVAGPLGEDGGQALGLPHLGDREAGVPQGLRQVLGRTPDVALVRGVAGDRGDS